MTSVRVTAIVYRHVLISEYKTAISRLPADLSRAAVVSWDPLPPANSINTYTAPPRQPTALGISHGLSACFYFIVDFLVLLFVYRWSSF
jgi:hypothetical protein